MTGTQPTRLYIKATHLGYKRGLRNQYNHTSLLKLDSVDSLSATAFYLGKKVAYITKVKHAGVDGSRFKVNWGVVCRSHGANGVVKAKFDRPLPPQSIGASCRVMLYPSRV